MKATLIALLLAAAMPTFGQSSSSTPASSAPVRVNTEVEELARGYAAAFSSIDHTPIYLTLRQGDAMVTLVSVTSLKARAGVLLVELDSGLKYIINPKDVVVITDAPPKKG